MASENPRKWLREEVTCPICREYFTNPVILACEHSVCQSCILYTPTSTLCPLCKTSFCTQNIKLNHDLAGFVEISKLLNDQEKAATHDICKRHQEPLKLFCKRDEVLICTLCKEEHQGHNIIPAEEAALEYKDRLSDSLEALKKCKKKIMATISARQAKSEDLFKQMATERQKVAVKFGDLWLFLKEQEERMLAWMKEMEEQTQSEKDRYVKQLYQPLFTLKHLIREVREKKDLPASRLLPDKDAIMKRIEQLTESKGPGFFSSMVKRKAANFTNSRPKVERALKKFKDTVASSY
ncbi:zinc finger protein RFP-like isoform X2 [Heteronotia binoei]|uniref:zinc finger protein RFP-like isoform X2 n=1 Tax=Heteronotia binoei TaxID=13085 RepID=UPI00292D8535|nr:zinc finger protein RFP-like isoform X2 [Heteronotia binoei]XP_060095108.1 zinc finger protein RFP-like isoform X2 [Heteronotia binoei]